MELKIFNLLHGLTNQSPIGDWFVVFLAQWLPYLTAIAAVWFLWRQGDWRRRSYDLALVALTLLLSRGLITETIRFFYDRLRPFAELGFEPLIRHASGGAFPSGHAAFYFALALAIYLINRKAGDWFLASAVLISLARVAAGLHWPLDILGGFAAGLISVFVINWLLPKSTGDKA